MLRRLAGIVAAACLLGGCGQMFALVGSGGSERTTYAVPVERARSILASAEEPPLVFGDGGSEFRLLEQAPTRLVWTVSRDGGEVLRFTANLEAAGDGRTAVSLALVGSTGGKYGNVEERLKKSETVRQLYLAAMHERIAADLEGRDYDLSEIYPQLAAATAANLHLLQPPDNRGRDRANMKNAYREELEAGRNY